jgi:hypothetical protein
MKQCKNCYAQMPDEAKFCGNCGSPFNEELIEPQVSEQQPVFQQQPTTVIIQSQTNGLGAAGFAVSFIGLFTFYIPIFGWLIIMIGSLLSYYGRKKEPKGLAIAGTVISVLNVILWLLSKYLYQSIINSLLDIF